MLKQLPTIYLLEIPILLDLHLKHKENKMKKKKKEIL